MNAQLDEWSFNQLCTYWYTYTYAQDFNAKFDTFIVSWSTELRSSVLFFARSSDILPTLRDVLFGWWLI